MATGTLTNNTGTITCQKQNNTITLSTANTFVDSDIQLNIKVIKAVLTTSSGNNEFYIEVPNGAANQTVVFHFTVDTNGNTTITEEDVPSS